MSCQARYRRADDTVSVSLLEQVGAAKLRVDPAGRGAARPGVGRGSGRRDARRVGHAAARRRHVRDDRERDRATRRQRRNHHARTFQVSRRQVGLRPRPPSGTPHCRRRACTERLLRQPGCRQILQDCTIRSRPGRCCSPLPCKVVVVPEIKLPHAVGLRDVQVSPPESPCRWSLAGAGRRREAARDDRVAARRYAARARVGRASRRRDARRVGHAAARRRHVRQDRERDRPADGSVGITTPAAFQVRDRQLTRGRTRRRAHCAARRPCMRPATASSARPQPDPSALRHPRPTVPHCSPSPCRSSLPPAFTVLVLSVFDTYRFTTGVTVSVSLLEQVGAAKLRVNPAGRGAARPGCWSCLRRRDARRVGHAAARPVTFATIVNVIEPPDGASESPRPRLPGSRSTAGPRPHPPSGTPRYPPPWQAPSDCLGQPCRRPDPSAPPPSAADGPALFHRHRVVRRRTRRRSPLLVLSVFDT